MNQEKIGNFIAEIRKEQNMTQQDLANRLNVTDRAISNWENGRRMPDYSLLMELCNVLNVSINELLAGTKISKEDYNKIADENLIKIIERQNKEAKNFEKRMMILLIITTIISMIIITLLPLKTIKDIIVFILVILLAFITNTLNMIALVLKKDNNEYLNSKGVLKMNIIDYTGKLNKHDDYLKILNKLEQKCSYIEVVILDERKTNELVINFENDIMETKKVSKWWGTETKSKNNLYKIKSSKRLFEYLSKYETFCKYIESQDKGYYSEITDFGIDDIAFYDEFNNYLLYTTTHEGEIIINKELI